MSDEVFDPTARKKGAKGKKLPKRAETADDADAAAEDGLISPPPPPFLQRKDDVII